VLATPVMPATMIVTGIVWCSLSKEALCAWVYLGDSLLYYNLVVLLDYADREQYSCSGSEGSEEVCSRCYYSDRYSSNYRDGRYVPVENLAHGGSGSPESFDLHPGVDELFGYGLRVHSADLDPGYGKEDAGQDEYGHVDCGSYRVAEHDAQGSWGERVVGESL